MTYYYLDQTNQRRGPVDQQQLQELVAQGVIGPDTPMETDAGQKGVARQIPGLFPTSPQPSPTQTVPVPPLTPPPPKEMFCTNCGKPVSEQAVACMSCGAKPVGHRKFCRHCAAALTPEQIVCVKCGAKVGAGSMIQAISGTVSGTKNKIAAGLLGILLGAFGAHKFYMGSWGWGLVFLFCGPVGCFIASILVGILSVITLGLGAILYIPLLIMPIAPCISGIIEGIIYLTMSDETFAAKYPAEAQRAFRW